MNKYRKSPGWYNESERHSLAARGVKTKLPVRVGSRKVELDLANIKRTHPQSHSAILNKDYITLTDAGVVLMPDGDADKDGVPNRYDCKPLDPKRQGLLHRFIKKNIDKKIVETENPEHEKALLKARAEAPQLKTKRDVKGWIKRHKAVLITTGLYGVLIGAAALAGSGAIMMNTATGQIVRVGATRLGSLLVAGSLFAGGAAMGSGLQTTAVEAQEDIVREKLEKGEITKEEADRQLQFFEKDRPEKKFKKYFHLAQDGASSDDEFMKAIQRAISAQKAQSV